VDAFAADSLVHVPQSRPNDASVADFRDLANAKVKNAPHAETALNARL
jgi:hypothetical protein